MDPFTIGGLVLTAAGALFAYLQWRHPRAPKVQAPEPPAPEPATTSEPPKTGLIVSITIAAVGYDALWCIMVEAANPNPRPRRIVAIGFELEDKRQVAILAPGSDKGLPCVLNETENVHYWADAAGVAKVMHEKGITTKQKIRAMVRDSYDDKHFSKWIEFDPQSWIKRHKAGVDK